MFRRADINIPFLCAMLYQECAEQSIGWSVMIPVMAASLMAQYEVHA